MVNVDVYIADIKKVKNDYQKLYDKISDFRKERADSYYHEDDKLRSVVSAFLVKTFIKKEELKYNEYGKPYIEGGPYFNVSHCDNYVVLAVSENEVGIDIEEVKKRDLSFLNEILDKDITAYPLETQYLLWCAKESMAKCLGTGLRDIKEAPCEPLNGKKHYKGQDFYSTSFVHQKYAFSITLKSREAFKTIEHIVDLSKYAK